MSGKKGRSGRKSKRFESEIERLKDLALRRAIKTLQDEIEFDKENPLASFKMMKGLEKRQDDVMLKILDKAIPTETKISGNDDGDPIRIIFRASPDSSKPKAG